MTSLVRSLFRTSSIAVDDKGSSVASSRTASPYTYSGSFGSSFKDSLTNSPSFNDFSMHIAQEVDNDLDKGGIDQRLSLDSSLFRASPKKEDDVPRRHSVDVTSHKNSPYPCAPASPLAPMAAGTAEGARRLFLKTTSSPMPIKDSSASLPLQSSLSIVSEPVSPSTPISPSGRRRHRQGKIDGLDFYEFCELIRSSSL